MEKKTEIINKMIAEIGYKSYLEIGYGIGTNFNAVVCDNKISVDPEADGATHKQISDDFFKENTQTFDLIFIDGLHHADQCRKDIVNAMKCLSDDGAILVHDINPADEAMQIVPRQQREWTGDVWRTWVGFKAKYPDIETTVFDEPYGLGCILPKGKKVRAHFEDTEMLYQEFEEKKEELLHGF